MPGAAVAKPAIIVQPSSETVGAAPLDFVESPAPNSAPLSSSTIRKPPIKKTTPQRLVAIVVGTIVAFVAFCIVLGNLDFHGGGGGGGGGGSATTSASINDFIDNTQKYKNETLQFKMQMGSGELRQRIGGAAQFFLMDLDSGSSANVIVQIPRNLAVPNVSYMDPVVVAFKCTEGQLDSGNVATEIRRQ